MSAKPVRMPVPRSTRTRPTRGSASAKTQSHSLRSARARRVPEDLRCLGPSSTPSASASTRHGSSIFSAGQSGPSRPRMPVPARLSGTAWTHRSASPPKSPMLTCRFARRSKSWRTRAQSSNASNGSSILSEPGSAAGSSQARISRSKAQNALPLLRPFLSSKLKPKRKSTRLAFWSGPRPKPSHRSSPVLRSFRLRRPFQRDFLPTFSGAAPTFARRSGTSLRRPLTSGLRPPICIRASRLLRHRR